MIPLHLDWRDASGRLYQGGSYLDAWQTSPLSYGVLAPGSYSDIKTAVLQNTAIARRLQISSAGGAILDGMAESFINLKLYLQADPATVALLLSTWPDLDAGVELSFDQGISWSRLTSAWGNPDIPSTWIPLPGVAVAPDAADGELLPSPPYHRAVIQIRVKTPVNMSGYGLLSFSLVPDFDVL